MRADPDPVIPTVHGKGQRDWLPRVVEALREVGCAVVDGVLSSDLMSDLRARMYRAQQKIVDELGEERLQAANELGVLRLMMKADPTFIHLLEIPEMLAVVDATLSSTAILHLQNGFILPATDPAAARVFQSRFHRDFPRYLNGYLASVNVFFALDDYTADNGGTRVVLGSHQRDQSPAVDQMERLAVTCGCAAGSMIVFDSTLWHAAGINTTATDRLGINHQFTRSYIKQQIDYVRALGSELVERQAPRTQQLLGYYTRVVTSLDEYYQPEEKRLYRKGQG